MGSITVSPNLYRVEAPDRPITQRKDETRQQYTERRAAWRAAEAKNPLRGKEFKTEDALRKAMEKQGMKPAKWHIQTFFLMYW